MTTPKFDGLQARRKIRAIRLLAAGQNGEVDLGLVCEQLHLSVPTAHCYLRYMRAKGWLAGVHVVKAVDVPVNRDPMICALFGKERPANV